MSMVVCDECQELKEALAALTKLTGKAYSYAPHGTMEEEAIVRAALQHHIADAGKKVL